MASASDQPDLKTALFSFQFAEPGDAFDRAFEEARMLVGSGFMPRTLDVAERRLTEISKKPPANPTRT
jgi:hypothetical protein